MMSSPPVDVTAASPAMAGDLTHPLVFENFISAHSHAVLGVCRRMLKDSFAAEDACQETFVAAWRQRQSLRPNRGWLLKVAANKCLDELRRRSRHYEIALDVSGHEQAHPASKEPSPESVVLSSQARETLEAALRRLPWSQRVAVVLADMEDWTYAEIAGACGISIGTVKSRVFRARRALRELVGEAGL